MKRLAFANVRRPAAPPKKIDNEDYRYQSLKSLYGQVLSKMSVAEQAFFATELRVVEAIYSAKLSEEKP